MNEPNWVTRSTTNTLAFFSVVFLILFAFLLLTGCTCPDGECPVFPNAMPGQ